MPPEAFKTLSAVVLAAKPGKISEAVVADEAVAAVVDAAAVVVVVVADAEVLAEMTGHVRSTP